MAVRSSARPADLAAYHSEVEVIAAYLARHADDLDAALGGAHGAGAAGVRSVVGRMRALGGWVQGLADAFAAVGGTGTAVGATALVSADRAELERDVGVDTTRPYRSTDGTPVFEDRAVSIDEILRDHLWDGVRSLWPGGDSPADVALDMLEELAEQLAPQLLNQMLSMRAYDRMPDYVVAEADAFTPFYGLGAGAFITYTRSGEIFVAPEGGVGFPGGGVSVRAGWLDQNEMPSGDEVDAFVEGWAVTGSVGMGQNAVAATWNVGSEISDLAYEQGAEVGEDPASITVSFSGDVGDSGYGWTG